MIGITFRKNDYLFFMRTILLCCTKCGYTEIYKTATEAGMNVLDFLMN